MPEADGGAKPGLEDKSTDLQKFVKSKPYEMFMFCVIILNCVTMAISDPKKDDSLQASWIVSINVFFNVAYICDVLLGVTAFGFVRYMLDPWHYIDLIVSAVSAIDIVVAILQLILGFFRGSSIQFSGSSASDVRILRIFRVMRPLKAVSFIPSLMIFVESVFQSAVEIGANMLMLVLIQFIFAAVGCAWIGNALAYRCLPTDYTNANVVNDPHYIAYGASYYTSKYNYAFCGGEGLTLGTLACSDGFSCQPVPQPQFFYSSAGDYSTPWRAFITNMAFVTLRGWPTLFWQITQVKGIWIAYCMFFMNVVFGTLMCVNLFPAIFILTFRTNTTTQNKRLWLRYYPGLINGVKEIELFRWAFTAGALLQQKAADESDASVTTQAIRNVWRSFDPKGHDAAMVAVEEKKVEWMNMKENKGKMPEDRLGKVPWRPCLPPCTLWDKLRGIFMKDDSAFNKFIIVAIVGSIVLMSTESSSMSNQQVLATYWLYVMFNTIFALEIVVKVVLVGPIVYLDSLFNLFDLFLVLMGLLQYGATVPKFITNLRIIRLLRLARLYKLLKIIQATSKVKKTDPEITFARLMGMVIDLIPPTLNALMVTLIFLYIFSLIGEQFLIYSFPFNEHLVATGMTHTNVTMTESIAAYNLFDTFGGKFRDRMNFNTFGNAFVTVFNIMMFNGWYNTMLDSIRNVDNTFVAWYFVVVVFFCNYFTVSTIAATVVNMLEEEAKNTLNEQARYNSRLILHVCDMRRKGLLYTYFTKFKVNTVENEEAREAAAVSGNKPSGPSTSKIMKIEEHFEEPLDRSWWEKFKEERKDYSFFLFQPKETTDEQGRVTRYKNVRYYMDIFVESRFVTLVISITLLWAVISIIALGNITGLPSELNQSTEIIMLAIFLAEMLAKMIVYGVDGYFKNIMYAADFITNVAMVLAYVLPFLYVLNGVRVLRLVKIPEMIQRFSKSLSLQLLVQAIEQSPTSLFTISVTFCLIIYFYGVIGLQTWSGNTSRCSDPKYPGGYSLSASAPGYPNGCSGLAYQQNQYDNVYYWVPLSLISAVDNFDDIFTACKSVFRIFTLNDFQGVLYTIIDAPPDDRRQPYNNANRIAFVYSLFGGILALTLLQLLMATVYYHYVYASAVFKRKKAFGLVAAAWNLYEDKLRHVPEAAESENTLLDGAHGWREKLAQIMSSRFYTIFVGLFSIIPLILYVAYFVQTYSQPYFAQVDVIFSLFYLFDYLLRLLILGRSMFYKDGKHEVVVVVALCVSIYYAFPSLTGSVVSSFQLKFTWACVMLRFYRMVHSSLYIKRMIRTLQMSVSGVVPTTLYLIMILLIYAVLGHTLFKGVYIDYGYKWLNECLNFSTYNRTLVLLVAMGTGNFYTEVLTALKQGQGLGWIFIVEIYFTSFIIIFIVFLKAFALMVIIKFIGHAGGSVGLANEQIKDFQVAWSTLHKEPVVDMATGAVTECIQWPGLEQLIRTLQKPLGLKGDEVKWIIVQRFAKQVLMSMPSDAKYWVDVDGENNGNKNNPRRRDLYRIEQFPEDLSTMRDHFTFRQCLVAFHKAFILPNPIVDQEAFEAERAKAQAMLGALRMAVARLAVSEPRLKDGPYDQCYRLLQIMQRLDLDLYRQTYLKTMEKIFNNMLVHVYAYGFQPFDGFLLSNLLKSVRCEKRSADLNLHLRRKLKASGSVKAIKLYNKTQVYNLALTRLFNRVEREYENNVSENWDISSLSQVLQVRERKSITAVDIDMLSNFYVASNGQLKIWKNMSGDAAITKETKFRKVQTIDFEKVHIRCIHAGSDGKRFYVGVGNDIFMYVMGGGNKKGKKGPYKEIKQFTPPHWDSVNALVSFSKYLVSAGSDNFVTLWTTTTFERVKTFDCGAPVFCLTLMPIYAPGVPKDDLTLTDVVVCGTQSGRLVVLDLPVGRKGEEKTLWSQAKYETVGEEKGIIGQAATTLGLDSSIPVTSLCYAWTFLYAALADGSVVVYATKVDPDKIGPTDAAKMAFFSLVRVSKRSVHNAPITGICYAGDHVFTASHDFSMLPFVVPENVNGKTPTQFEQEIGQGIVRHSAPILAMACNNHVLITGDNNGFVNVTGPTRTDILLRDGDLTTEIFSQVVFSFLEYDFNSVLCAHQGKVIEEECYLSVSNYSERTISIRHMLKKNPNWSIEPARSEVQPIRGQKKVMYEVKTNENIVFRIIFRPNEARFYRHGIEFLINEKTVITVHVKGTGVTPKVHSDTKMIDFETVDIIVSSGNPDEVLDGELRVLNLYSLSSVVFPVNMIEEVFTDKDKQAFTISDRNISITPRCFNIGPAGTDKERTEIIIKFSPSQAYSTFDVPLKFNIAGATYTLATLRFRSAYKKESKGIKAIGADLPVDTAGVPLNMLAVHALPKGLRPLRSAENICNSNMIMGMLAHRGWRLTTDDVLSCLYHVDTGIFLELPRLIDSSEIINHVEVVKIEFQCDHDCYWELWHDEINIDRGFGDAHKHKAVLVEKDLLYVKNVQQVRDKGTMHLEEVWTESIGKITLELLIFQRGDSQKGKNAAAPHKPEKKILMPERDPVKKRINGYLKSRTDIVIHKGFRLAPGEDGIGYDFLDRMDVAGIERICSFSDDGIISVYETFGQSTLSTGKQISPTFSSVSICIHSAASPDSPTHYRLQDVTGALEALHPSDPDSSHHDHGADKHVSTKEDLIVNISGTELVELGRPHGKLASKERDSKDSRAALCRMVEVYLTRKSGSKGEMKTVLLNPAAVQPPGSDADPTKKKPSTVVQCHTMANMTQRSRASNVPVDQLFPHSVHSTSHSVNVSVVVPRGEPELRISKLSSMIDEMKGQNAMDLTKMHHMSSHLHDGLWHFVLDGNDLKLVSADMTHARYTDIRTSTDVYLTSRGFIGQLDNETRSVLYCDQGYAMQIDDREENIERGYYSGPPDAPKEGESKMSRALAMLNPFGGAKAKPSTRSTRPQRYDNFHGTQVKAMPAPHFLREIWDARCADSFVDVLRRAYFKLLERRQQHLHHECERQIKEMERDWVVRQPEIVAKRGAKAAHEARLDLDKKIHAMEGALVFTKPADADCYKHIYNEVLRVTGEYLKAKAEAAKKAKAGSKPGDGDGEEQQDDGDSLNNAAFAAGKLVVFSMQDYLEEVILPGQDKVYTKARAERVLRGLDREASTGAVSLDAFKIWYNTRPSVSLIKDLTERTVFARVLQEEFGNEAPEDDGFLETDIHLAEHDLDGDTDLKTMHADEEVDGKGFTKEAEETEAPAPSKGRFMSMFAPRGSRKPVPVKKMEKGPGDASLPPPPPQQKEELKEESGELDDEGEEEDDEEYDEDEEDEEEEESDEEYDEDEDEEEDEEEDESDLEEEEEEGEESEEEEAAD